MQIAIDPSAGFCFGVRNAIARAEILLSDGGKLLSLGEIVHNQTEVERLTEKGLKVVDREEFEQLRNCNVLIRAHGEPPSTYETAESNNIQLVDATCPIVRRLQNIIAQQYQVMDTTGGQVVIFGKPDHPEVVGLNGRVGGRAVIVQSYNDIKKINPQREVHLFAQTTMNPADYESIALLIRDYLMENNPDASNLLHVHRTICRQVTNRIEVLKKFSSQHDVVIFVSGRNSSNGKFLFGICQQVNPSAIWISHLEDISVSMVAGANSVGITGATSTSLTQLEAVADYLRKLTEQ